MASQMASSTVLPSVWQPAGHARGRSICETFLLPKSPNCQAVRCLGPLVGSFACAAHPEQSSPEGCVSSRMARPPANTSCSSDELVGVLLWPQTGGWPALRVFAVCGKGGSLCDQAAQWAQMRDCIMELWSDCTVALRRLQRPLEGRHVGQPLTYGSGLRFGNF